MASIFDMFCTMTRFYFCFACQHWRRQPQAKLADRGDETAAVHRRPPGWTTVTVHNAAKTPLKRWKSQHRLQRKGNNPWLSTMCLWPETTDSADTHVGSYTVTLHKRQSLPMQDHHVHRDILHMSSLHNAQSQDAHLRHMNTLLLDRAQSFVHLAHPTSS